MRGMLDVCCSVLNARVECCVENRSESLDRYMYGAEKLWARTGRVRVTKGRVVERDEVEEERAMCYAIILTRCCMLANADDARVECYTCHIHHTLQDA
jgi:hypothetical protein